MPKGTDVSASRDHTPSSDANTYIELDDDVDDNPLAVEAYEEGEELPCSMGVKKAKVKTSSKGKGVEDVATKLDYMFHKIVDMMEQFNAKTAQMLEFKERKLEMEILYKDRSQMDPETLEFHKEHCAIIRGKYGKK
ncbi:hypothetical protein L1987_02603 [Smallanthus sonchifolius]|uniref:Uncharacterized protein n=1 Tax=Smallanthus sonchifolius TaxID=185202 RepID=A0ACB9K8B1_9ASTR|nr:hypothetical protein L1987_02603 [Smallanthus sonchifolius]